MSVTLFWQIVLFESSAASLVYIKVFIVDSDLILDLNEILLSLFDVILIFKLRIKPLSARTTLWMRWCSIIRLNCWNFTPHICILITLRSHGNNSFLSRISLTLNLRFSYKVFTLLLNERFFKIILFDLLTIHLPLLSVSRMFLMCQEITCALRDLSF